MNNDAYLISRTFTIDEVGNQTATETETLIPVEIRSVSRDEFYRAGEQKLNPEMVLITAAENYSGQELVKVDNVRYSIYRKYQDPAKNDDIELYCRKEVGNG